MSYYLSQSGTTYPYSSYGNYPQTAGAYPYQTAYPPTAVAGYGATWPYPYSYYPQHQQAQQPGAPTAPKPAVPSTSTAAPPALANVAATQPQRPAPTTYTFTPSYTPIAAAAGTSGRSGRKQPTFKGLFSKELRNLMYGFGDDRNPANDTVNVMKEILVEYIVDVCQTASASGKGKTRLSIEELRRALSRPADAKKLARMEELLFMQEDIKRARAEFDESEVSQGGSFQT